MARGGRWRTKPPYAQAELDRSHPLAVNLQGFWPFNEGGGRDAGCMWDLVTGRPNSRFQTEVSWVKDSTAGGAGGVAVHFTGGSPGQLDLDNRDVFAGDLGLTVSILARPVSTGVPRCVIIRPAAVDSGQLLWSLMQSDSAGAGTQLRIRSGDGTNQADAELASFWVLNEWHLYTVRWNASGTFWAYRDGVQIGTGALGNQPGSTTGVPVRVGTDSGGGTRWNGQMGLVAIWNRPLDAGEVVQFSRNPWDLLEPHRDYFFVAGGGTQFTQSVSGTVTSAGALVKQTGKALAGATASAGALLKETRKVLTGAVTSSGALVGLRTALLALTGAIASSGALTRSTAKVLAAGLTSAGSALKQTAKAFTGALASAGALVSAKVVLLALTGALTSSGTLVRQTGKALAGVATSAGSLARLIRKGLSGAASFVGALVGVGSGGPGPVSSDTIRVAADLDVLVPEDVGTILVPEDYEVEP